MFHPEDSLVGTKFKKVKLIQNKLPLNVRTLRSKKDI